MRSWWWLGMGAPLFALGYLGEWWFVCGMSLGLLFLIIMEWWKTTARDD